MNAAKGRSRLPLNSFLAMMEPVAQGLSLFFLYRTVLNHMAPTELGLWSMLAAVIAMMQMGDLGIGRVLVRYVALGSSVQINDTVSVRNPDAAEFVHCGLLATAGLYGILCFAVWLCSDILLGLALPATRLAEARSLFPLMLVSFWLYSISQVFLATLIGAHRAGRRSLLVVFSEAFQLLVVLTTLKSQGIMALVYGQLTRNLLLLLAGSVQATAVVPGLAKWPRPSYLAMREIISLGIKVQSTSLVAFFFEPTTKLLLGRFGSLDAVAWFELASRVVLQVRALVVSACQLAVPVIAELGAANPSELRVWYRRFSRCVSLAAIFVMGSFTISIPLVSHLWIGHFQPQFVAFTAILTGAWFVNLMSVPAYMLALGLARVGWNFVAHALMGVGNLAIGGALGAAFGAVGCVLGWGIALSLGSLLIIGMNQRQLRIDLTESIDAGLLVAAATTLLSSIFALGVLPIDGPTTRLLTTTLAACMLSSVLMLPGMLLDRDTRLLLLRLWGGRTSSL